MVQCKVFDTLLREWTIMVLVMWELWKHMNVVVFDGATPSIQRVMRKVDSEGCAWRQAGLLKGNLDFLFLWGSC